MSSPPAEKAHDLGDFADFLRQLGEDGFEFVVIGGMAVSAYAHLIDEPVLSVDLDIYVTQETMVELLAWAPRHDCRVVKRPRPRSIPVAFIEASGKEVNILTSTSALPAPEMVIRTAHAEDREALRLARKTRVNPAEMQWRWISLALQFPKLRQSRETAAGREEFRLR